MSEPGFAGFKIRRLPGFFWECVQAPGWEKTRGIREEIEVTGEETGEKPGLTREETGGTGEETGEEPGATREETEVTREETGEETGLTREETDGSPQLNVVQSSRFTKIYV